MSEKSGEKQCMDFNLKTTELRLGPPGSERDDFLGAGPKRAFSGSGSGSGTGSSMELDKKHNSSASKTEVVGWPPIRSFRKNSMATTTNNPKTNDKVEGGGSGGGSYMCVYVKVSMDGAPYLRKVDLNTYAAYADLSAALESMFSCFTIGQYGYNGVPGRDGLILSGTRLKDSSEQCVLTYEDKDGDWMLVGDVPWHMFTNTCRRIRITKRSEAIGLASRAMEKCKKDE